MPTPATLWQLQIRTSGEAEDAVASALQELLHCPTTSYALARTSVVTVSAHLAALPRARANILQATRTLLAHIRNCGLDPSPGHIRLRRLPPENWAESWKRHFPPITIGRTLLIRPSWSRRTPARGQAVLELDPGLSFGTGHHPTTRFCLDQIVRCHVPRQPRSLLDIGTGSGMLALAAARLGFHPVEGFDLDPTAVRVSRDNARRNRLFRKVEIRQADVRRLPLRPRRRFSVVCANLTADLLTNEARRIAAQVQPDGTLLLAGILRRELPTVCRTYRTLGFRTVATRRENEWASARLHLRARPETAGKSPA